MSQDGFAMLEAYDGSIFGYNNKLQSLARL